MDAVGPAAAVERQQGAVGEPADVHVNAARAVRHLDLAPGGAAVGGDLDRRGVEVADPFFPWPAVAVEHRQQPLAARQHRRRVADEGAGGAAGAEQGLDRAPGVAVVGRDAPPHDGGVLVARELRRPQQPEPPVRGGEEHRVLLGPRGIVGKFFRRRPACRTGGEAREIDGDVGDALLGAAEPDAAQVAAGQRHEVGGVGLHGGGGQEGFQPGGIEGGGSDHAGAVGRLGGEGLGHRRFLVWRGLQRMAATAALFCQPNSHSRPITTTGVTAATYMLSTPYGLPSTYHTVVITAAASRPVVAPRLERKAGR